MLESNTEYSISDVYLPTMKGNARKRGTLFFRTDSEGRVWIKDAGRVEDAAMTKWFETHPRLTRIGKF